MAQCSQKSHISLRLLLFLIFLSIILAAVIVLNAIIGSSKIKLTETTESFFSKKVSIKRIFYLPPNFIILKDVSVNEPLAGNKKLFSFPTITARFSLPQLFLRKKLDISGVNFYYPRSDYKQCGLFLKDNFARILEFIRH
ncbi:MAG: hypothetical protein PHN57_06645, partial [Candidatus Omnitrophica bacterium]|nr:hypothetical protein [Candidatus Omnitrophota bacterium]